MYERFYHLQSKPFGLVPDNEFLYLGSTHRIAYSLLECGLVNLAPFMVLTGDPGMGKTSLLQKLIAEYRTDYAVGFLTNIPPDADHLMPWVLMAFGQNRAPSAPVEAYHAFSEFLSEEAKRRRRVILIVDEAQGLGVKRLEELRLLSNVNQDGSLRLQIILSGQPDLHLVLQRLDMTQFAQRIAVDYHLQPFTEEETADYIRHRLHVAGGTRSLFSREACELARRLSRGNPRLINQVADMALTFGFARQATRITAALLAQAASDRRKNKILPLAEVHDLAVIAKGPDESESAEKPNVVRFHAASTAAPPTAKDLFPSLNAETLFQQGLARKKSGEFQAAIEPLTRAAGDPSYHLSAFGQIGACYRAMGQLSKAVEAFRHALDDQSASGRQRLTVRYQLGLTLERLGRRAEALEQYRTIKRVDPAFKDTRGRLSQIDEELRNGRPARESSLSPIGQAWRHVRQLLGGLG